MPRSTRRTIATALSGFAVAVLTLTACGSGQPSAHSSAATPSSSATTSSPAPASSAAPTASAPAPTPATTSSSVAVLDQHNKPKPAAPTPQQLPLALDTGSATQVITVVASSQSQTTATLQAWTKVTGGWLPATSAVTAHLGSDGMSPHPSEGSTHTPMGSFTLTQAFGHDANPGTALPYLQTTPDDWWISQPGALYNTEQHCASGCAFTQGDPNEHLYYETPYYDYAVVIDYNTANAGPVVQGAGSAFFLHVTDGRPTAGCVSIPAANLVTIMKWLSPSGQPRILIGTA